MRYRPVSSLTAERLFSIRTGLDGFDGDARQHGAGTVAHDAGDGCLDGALREGVRAPDAKPADGDKGQRQ